MGCSHPRYVCAAGEAEAKQTAAAWELLKGALPWPCRGESGASSSISMSWCGLCSPQASCILELSIPATTEEGFFPHFLSILGGGKERKNCQGIKTLLKEKLLQVMSEPQWKCFRGERRPARGKHPSPCLPPAAQFFFFFTSTWACSCCWSSFTKLLVQLLLFPYPCCGFQNPDLEFDHYTVFLKLWLWPAEQCFLAGFSHSTSNKYSLKWDAKLLVRYRVCGRHQPALEHRAKLTRLVWFWLQAHYSALINTRPAAVTVQG